MRGIRMSIRTTSGPRSRGPARPPRAVARPRPPPPGRGASRRARRSRPRTNAWSSATTTRITGHRLRRGQLRRTTRKPPSGLGPGGEPAAEHRDPLAHAESPCPVLTAGRDRGRVRRAGRARAGRRPAGDRRRDLTQRAGSVADRRTRRPAPACLTHVGQRLLDDPVGDRSTAGGSGRASPSTRDPTLHARPRDLARPARGRSASPGAGARLPRRLAVAGAARPSSRRISVSARPARRLDRRRARCLASLGLGRPSTWLADRRPGPRSTLIEWATTSCSSRAMRSRSSVTAWRARSSRSRSSRTARSSARPTGPGGCAGSPPRARPPRCRVRSPPR